MSASEREVVILVASCPLPDRKFLRSVFDGVNWKPRFVGNFDEFRTILLHTPPGVVIAEPVLEDGHSWKDILAELQRGANPPNLIVTTDLRDDNLWGEVLNLGGYDMLMKPFDRVELIRVVSLAWLDWKQRSQGSQPAPSKAAA